MGGDQVTVLLFILTVVVVPMLVTEFTAWRPWFADCMVRAAARTLPPDVRERYTDEWLAELDAEPGGDLSKLFFAARVCLRARATGSAIRGGVPRPGMAVKRTFDLAAAASALFLLAPLLVFVALAVRIEDGGPVFFADGHGRQGWPSLPHVQVPDCTRPGRVQAMANHGTWLPTAYPDGCLAAPLVPGRAAAAYQRAEGRNVPGWAASCHTLASGPPH